MKQANKFSLLSDQVKIDVKNHNLFPKIIIQIHSLILDGSLLPTDPSTGRFVDDRGETIQLDEFNRPLNPEGYPLPTNLHHQYIYPEPEKHQTIVVDPEGHPLQKDSQGNFLKPDGSLIQKDSKDKLVNFA